METDQTIERTESPRSKKPLRVIMALLMLLLVGFGCFAIWTYRELHAPQVHLKSTQYIEVNRGATPADIISKLVSQGILKRAWPLSLYMKLTGRGDRLRAGEYRFQSPISPLDVLRKLEEGEDRLRKVTIIEGWTRWDIAQELARIPELKLESPKEALALMDDVSLIKNLDPHAQNLEGYLYPDTYSFPFDATAKEMVSAMVKRFHQAWQPEWADRARELKMTPRQIVTIASLIETEAKLPEDRPNISSVIYNRLRKNMPLGIDSSIIYASKLAGKWKNDGKVYKSDLDRNTPYNTRLHTGLPPGPIASPSASSLKAAIFPSETDYLYYVREPSRNDGAHNFYSDAAGFSRGVAALREWERQRDATSNSQPNSQVK